MKITRSILFTTVFGLLCCSVDKTDDDPAPALPTPTDGRYPVVKSDCLPARQPTGDMILDFSRVGYRWGDAEIPTVAVVATLTPPADGADATNLIQSAIDKTVAGAIVLKKGVYNISGTIRIGKSGIVLRGEGDTETDGTVLVATGAVQRDLIVISGTGPRSVDDNTAAYAIKDDYIPAGQFWVRSPQAAAFKKGDNVVIYRPSTQEWITDMKMDQIPQRADGLSITQWQAGKFDTYAERVVTLVSGDTIHFENPVAMSLDRKYGGGRILKYSYPNRIEECGIENMYLKSEYAEPEDENHGWNAVAVKVAAHCWVRNVTSRHFGMGLVTMDNGSKNISILNCSCLDPVSKIAGSRRYSFHISQGQLCLVKGCRSDNARHDFATGALNCGPNVFTNCIASRTHADIGPHQRWNTATLYDNVTSDGEICIQDRSNYGSGQGWAGGNNVLWNCTGSTIIVQNPWVSAYNYSVGTIGNKSPGKFTNPGRPDGVWALAGPQNLARLPLRSPAGPAEENPPGGVMDIR